MQIAIALFDRLTALDAIGPYEVLSRVPGADVVFCAEEPGPQRTDRRNLALMADYAFAEMAQPDVIVVPGGPGTRMMLEGGHPVTEWVRRVHPTTNWTTSVCTGSLVLAAAGVLEGVDAATHWNAKDVLASLGAVPSDERVVLAGKVVTAAGVSAGIDMALTLAALIAGDEIAQSIQLGIEYDPQPPFATGSLATSPAAVIDLARANAQAALANARR